MTEAALKEAPSTQVATAPQTALAITPMQMLQIAVEQNADLDKLQKLMDLQERWEATEARKAYVTAMTAFKKDPPEIVKDTHVKYDNKGGGVTEYDHESLNVISIVIGKALAEHGLHHSWETAQESGGLITVTCILGHELGYSKRVSLSAMPDLSGGKNPVQGVGSTVSYLERYTLKAVVGLAASGQDDVDNAPTGKPVPEERPTRDQYTKDAPPETDLGKPFVLTDEFGNDVGQYDTADHYVDAASLYVGRELSKAEGAAATFHQNNQDTLDRVTRSIGSGRDNSKVGSFYRLLNGKKG